LGAAATTGGGSTATGGGATATGGGATGGGAAGALATITGGGATGGDGAATLCVDQGRAASAEVAFAGSAEATIVASCHCGGEEEVAVVGGVAVALVATEDDGVAGGVADGLELNMLSKKPVTALSTPANGFELCVAGGLAAGAALGATEGVSTLAVWAKPGAGATGVGAGVAAVANDEET
jgi:hypothetical protein